jgi:hypothetical protein
MNPLFLLLSLSAVVDSCCLNHPNKPDVPLDVANYNCANLEPFSRDRCNSVYGGNVCQWKEGRKCNKFKKCKRFPYYEEHFQHSVDVGRCVGKCKTNSCKPSVYSEVSLSDTESVRVIKDCECLDCNVLKTTKVLEVPVGICEKDCKNQGNSHRVLTAGLNDNFDTSNGLEPNDPSILLLSGILGSCSAGIQTGFDMFIDNRCFGHTFTDILGSCPLYRATLEICIKAAQVSLTHTDSLILGVNGNSVWGKSLPSLNGGHWNPGDTKCLTLDLNNLPIDNFSMLSVMNSVGHLDVVVQDDSAVDYLVLTLEQTRCLQCLPINVAINSLYQSSGVTNFVDVKECDCVNVTACERVPYTEVHFPGTIYETNVDKGQCVGRCPYYNRCQAKEQYFGNIRGPEGPRIISKIKTCGCGKMPYNPLAIYKE